MAHKARDLSPIYLSSQNDALHANEEGVLYRRPLGKLIAFGWYGGKFSHLNWLLPLLPKCHHYCEPFAGSAAVLLNREPSPVETYNDIDGEVANFFRVLRDNKGPLVESIGLTPFSREEFYYSVSKNPARVKDEIERARLFYVRAQVSMSLLWWTVAGRVVHRSGEPSRQDSPGGDWSKMSLSWRF
jgi:DNA adenine methylase